MKKNIKVSKKQKVLHILLTILHIIGYVCIFIVAFALVLNSCSSKQPQKASAATEDDERTYSGQIYVSDYESFIEDNFYVTDYTFNYYDYDDYKFYDISLPNVFASRLDVITDQYYGADENVLYFSLHSIYSDVHSTFGLVEDDIPYYDIVYTSNTNGYIYDDTININTLNNVKNTLWYCGGINTSSEWLNYVLDMDDWDAPTQLFYVGIDDVYQEINSIKSNDYVTIQDLTYLSTDTISLTYYDPTSSEQLLFRVNIFDFFDNYCDDVSYTTPEPPEPPEPQPDLTNVFTLLTLAFSCIVPIFEISVVPGITFGLLFFLPLVTIIIVLVIKAVKP